MEPQITGYITAKGGIVQNATKETFGNAQLSIGGKVTNDYGLFVAGEAGYGSALQIKAEAGKLFEVSDNVEIKTSIGGQYLQSTHKTNYYKTIFEEGAYTGPSWNPKDIRGFGNAAINFKGDWGELGLGVQGGIKLSKKPELQPGELDETIGQTRNTDITGKKTKMYVTPTVTTKINLGGNFSLNIEAALDQGSAGIAFNF